MQVVCMRVLSLVRGSNGAASEPQLTEGCSETPGEYKAGRCVHTVRSSHSGGADSAATLFRFAVGSHFLSFCRHTGGGELLAKSAAALSKKPNY